MSVNLETHIDKLLEVAMFSSIEKDELIHILSCLNPNIKRFDKGEYIALEGHDFDGIGIVLKGKVTVTKTNEAGERIIMMQLGPKELFGEMVAFSSMKKWPATVVADSQTMIMFLKPEVIINHCQHMCVGHKQLMINMLEIVSNKALGLNRKLQYLSIKSMRGKLCKFLMEEYAKRGVLMFDISFNRNELAEFLHVSRPSMSRELSRMKEEGIIDFHQSTFKILDVEQLRDYASHLN